MENKNILVNTITAWYEPPRARHQVTQELIEDNNVFFVTRNELGKPGIDIEQINENLTLLVPKFPIDYRYRYRIKIINEIYQNWLFKKVRALNLNIDFVINFDFTAVNLSNFFNPVVYYCNDEYIGNSKYPVSFVNNYHKKAEVQVIKKSKICISTAKYLTKKLKLYNPHTYEIPLGAPEISVPLRELTKKHEEKKDKIHVGLVGFIAPRNISYDIINYLTAQEEFKITMIGPVEKVFHKKLSNVSDIEFKGVLTGNELYAEIAKFDVAIAPYDLEKINPGTTPNKMWQYYALGKPMVITEIENLKSFNLPEGTCYIAKSNKEFSDLIKKAHFENSEDLAKQRILLAGQNSWKKRIIEFKQIIDKEIV